MPRLISIEEAESGMVLAAPILNRYGQVLLAAGVEFQPKHSVMFKTWGIKLITIKEDEEENVVITDDIKKEAESRIYKRMQWFPETKLEKNLIEMAVQKVSKDIIKSPVNKNDE